jgi:hypothetical protein
MTEENIDAAKKKKRVQPITNPSYNISSSSYSSSSTNSNNILTEEVPFCFPSSIGLFTFYLFAYLFLNNQSNQIKTKQNKKKS